MSEKRQTILVFDSGVGGLTVLDPIQKARPDANYIYVADNAVFPYGELPETILLTRVRDVFDEMIPRFNPDLVVIACHTASTLVLPLLRERFSIPFVGTVPAIKPAAEQSQTKLISVLATQGTVKRDYTASLIRDFADDCEVILVSARLLASYAENILQGKKVEDELILNEIMPAFVKKGERKTDHIVLACTHYPLLTQTLQRLAPWPVKWIDPAPAIARRVVQLLGAANGEPRYSANGIAILTNEAAWTAELEKAFTAYGLNRPSAR